MLERSKVIAIISPKGGAGKTTTTANLAVALSNLGKKVLAIDANISTASLGFHFGINGERVTFKEVLDEHYLVSNAVIKYKPNLHIITNDISMEFGNKQSTINGSIRHLTNYYDIILSQLVRDYDVILLDSAPGFNQESIAAMRASDIMIMVINPEVPSVVASTKGIEYSHRLKKKILGVVLNKMLFTDYELTSKEIKEALNTRILAEVPYDENVLKAISSNKPVVDYNADSEAAIAYKKLAATILENNYSKDKSFEKRLMPINSARIKEVIGLHVYGEDGKDVGYIGETYIKNNKIFGWFIEVNQEIRRKLGKRYILIKHADVKSIKEVVIVDKGVSNYIARILSNPDVYEPELTWFELLKSKILGLLSREADKKHYKPRNINSC